MTFAAEDENVVGTQRWFTAKNILLEPNDTLPCGGTTCNNDCSYLVSQSLQDDVTGAEFVIVFVLKTLTPKQGPEEDFQGVRKLLMGDLHELSRIFWDCMEDKQLLKSFARLTNRQREVLAFAARGLTSHEISEHMGVSVRSIEKMLASAREQLGARTTAAALYRAMMFRLFD